MALKLSVTTVLKCMTLNDVNMLSLDQATIARQIIGTLMARCADYVREVWDDTNPDGPTFFSAVSASPQFQDLGMNLMVEAKGVALNYQVVKSSKKL